MLNRPDSESMPGGDTVQMLETKAALEALDVKVDVSLELSPDPGGHDLVHIFNLQRAAETYAQSIACRRHGIPVALSTIIWKRPSWRFDIQANPRWRKLRSVIPQYVLAPFCWLRNRWSLHHSQTWRLQRSAVSMADVLLPNSRAEGRFVGQFFRAAVDDRVRVIPNAVNARGFSGPPTFCDGNLPRLPRQPYVLEVARFEPLKNQLALILALFDVDVPIVFVGADGRGSEWYGRQCRDLAARRGNVLFLDYLPHEQLPPVYSAARVHVLPSFLETTGLVSLEAALMRCNVVTTDQGPTDEYFGSWAWYCSPFDVQSIRRAVLAALSAPFPEPLRERILNEFTWQKAAARTLEAYEWALSHRRGN